MAALMIAPGRLLRLLLIELAKMRRQRLALTVVVVPAAAAALVPQALSMAGTTPGQGFAALTTSLKLALLLGSFLIFLQAALSISSERAEKTLRDTIAGPARRSEVLLACWSALVLELLLLVAVVAALALLSTSLRFHFADITAGAVEPLFYAGEVAQHSIRAILYYLPPAMALVSVGLLVSVATATPGTSAALALGALLSLDVAKSLFSSAAWMPHLFFNAYLPTLFDRTSYLYGAAALAEGVGDVLWLEDSPRHCLNLVLPAAYVAGSLLLSLAIFCTKDFAE